MVAEAEVESTINYETSNIQEFYEGARIFITGGSGFLGNLLVQKLIRDCPDLSKIYLLIRAKKGKTSEQRLEEMLQDVVFERMKREQPKYYEKIKLIIGDMEQPNLGLKEEDIKIISDEVNIIFHVAATVKFDEKIKKATAINIKATRDLINLAKSITNLKAFVHISTAYSHCWRKEIDENIYDVPIKLDRLLKITETLSDEELDILTPNIIKGWPNTYTFTKAVAENVIKENADDLPIAIIRPSMVILTSKDPVEGWINNFYGPVGISVAIGLGLIRSVYVKPDSICDMIPGDYVINSMIASSYYAGQKFAKKDYDNVVFDELSSVKNIPVFNCTSGNDNPITWAKFLTDCSKYSYNWQTTHSVWYFFCVMNTNYYLNQFCDTLLHTIPAYSIDFALFVLGKKRRMVKIYEKLRKFQTVIEHFGLNEWKFGNENTQALWKSLSSTDRQLFPFSMKELHWNNYFKYYSRGLRIYLLKDPLDTLPVALARYQKLKIAHYLFVSVLCFIVFTILLRTFQMFWY